MSLKTAVRLLLLSLMMVSYQVHGREWVFAFAEDDPNSRIPFHIGVSKTLAAAEAFVASIDQVLASEAFKAQRWELIEEYRR